MTLFWTLNIYKMSLNLSTEKIHILDIHLYFCFSLSEETKKFSVCGYTHLFKMGLQKTLFIYQWNAKGPKGVIKNWNRQV